MFLYLWFEDHQEGGMNVGKLVQEMDGGSGRGGHTDAILAFSDIDKDEQQQSALTKGYYRHTERQTQLMES